jgi:hypothetical protein
MTTPNKEIIETRLNQWKLFFESEQARAVGFGTVLAFDDPRLIQEGADPETCDVEYVIKAATMLDAPDLVDLAELVAMMAINYERRTDCEYHAAMMQDDPADSVEYVRTPREGGKRLGSVNPAELDAILDAA